GAASEAPCDLDELVCGAPDVEAADDEGDVDHAGTGDRYWRSRLSSSRILRRLSIMSPRPCSRRNSEVWKPLGRSCRMVCSMTRGPAKPIMALGSARMTSPS